MESVPAPSLRILRRDLIAYIRRPVHLDQNQPVARPLTLLARLTLIAWLTIPVVIGLYLTLEYFGLSIPDRLDESFGSPLTKFVVLVVVAPFLEELIFRYPLRFSKGGTLFLVSLAILLLGYEVGLKSLAWSGVGVWLIAALYVRSPGTIALWEGLRSLHVRHFQFLYWGFAFGFGAAHLSNVGDAWQTHLWAIPVLMLHQAWVGLVGGYARMKYGFGYAVAMHVLNNGLAALMKFATSD